MFPIFFVDHFIFFSCRPTFFFRPFFFFCTTIFFFSTIFFFFYFHQQKYFWMSLRGKNVLSTPSCPNLIFYIEMNNISVATRVVQMFSPVLYNPVHFSFLSQIVYKLSLVSFLLRNGPDTTFSNIL